MENILVDEYYDKLLSYAKLTNSINYFNIIKLEDDYKRAISNIIDDNNIHLLSDDYLMHISRNSFAYRILNDLHNDNINMYYTFVHYYEDVVKTMNAPFMMLEDYKWLSLLGSDIDEVSKIIYDFITYLTKELKENLFEVDIIYKASLILFSYCHINKKMDEFETLYKKITDNYLQVADDVRTNGYNPKSYCDEMFINVVLNRIQGNKRKREII